MAHKSGPLGTQCVMTITEGDDIVGYSGIYTYQLRLFQRFCGSKSTF
jgi:hypothetical protein